MSAASTSLAHTSRLAQGSPVCVEVDLVGEEEKGRLTLLLRAHLARFKLLIWEEKHKGESLPGLLNGERCFLHQPAFV